jgi:EAL domain-containing protein (putative c-di-GMP-specific phosphodiesterase class I)
MLLIVSNSLRGTKCISDAARQLSLTLRHFDSPAALSPLMVGKARRIVLLDGDDVTRETINRLEARQGKVPFGLVIAADRAVVSETVGPELIDKLLEFRNFSWLGANFDVFGLGDVLKRCRRRMLQFTREEIEQAFSEFQFVLRYQPKVERGDGSEWQTREAEALIRWLHPDKGLLAPVEFLPEVEAYEMMPRLTEFVLRKAAVQIVKWREQGLGFDICVNLASSELGRTGLASAYAGIVREHGAECSNFTFEVVEQDLVDPDAAHLDTLKRLRNQAFRICLDNFRVAARSLSMLERLPFDEVKIHASALQRAQDDDVARHVLAAVTGLAHNLGMAVCAEGVEDQEMFEFLKTIECDKLQGFLISEAVLPHIVRRAYSATVSRNDEVA